MFFRRKSYSIEMLKVERTSENKRSDTDESVSNVTVFPEADHIIFRPFLGLFYMFLHSTSTQLSSVIIKMLFYMDPCQLSLIRNISILIGVLPIAIYHTRQIFGEKNDRPILLLRGFFAATGMYFQIIAYRYLPLAEASIIMSTFPIVTTIMARIILKEPYGLIHSVALILTMCGVILTLRIPKLVQNRNSVSFNSSYVAGFMACVGNVLLFSLSAVYIRKLKDVHFSVLLIHLSFVGIIESAIINGIFFQNVQSYCGWDSVLCLLFGACCFFASCLLTSSFKIQPAGVAAIEKPSFEIVIIIVLEIIFFNIYPDLYVTCGACLVISSLLVIGIRNWILLMPEESKLKRNVK